MATQSHPQPGSQACWTTASVLATLVMLQAACAPSAPPALPISSDNISELERIGDITVTPLHGVKWPEGSPGLAVIRAESVHVYDLATLTEQVLPVAHPSVIAFTQSGDKIAVGAVDGDLTLWDLTGEQQAALPGHTVEVTAIAFSADGLTLATLDINKQVCLWNLENSRLMSVINLSAWPAPSARIETIQLSEDGGTLAILSVDATPTIKLMDTRSGTSLRTLKWAQHARPFYNFMFSPNWDTVAWVAGGTVQLVDVGSGSTGPILAHEDALSEWRFSPDGSTFATRTAETIAGKFTGVVKLWDQQSGAARHTFAHPDFVSAMAFSPDWKRIATATGFGEMRLWETRTGRETAFLSGHSDTVWALAFSPDGELLASASSDGSVRLWDANSADALTTLSAAQKTSLADVRFSRNGDWIAAVADDGEITIWGISRVK
ncbi:MAG TPA: WD40 repeat domain-containing protein [Anaerolineales bacterium]|nr:WD40 repeat domain-containing protein [Anaerolineales bacterium]